VDLILELLDWAKGKDIRELHYEDRSGDSPTLIRLVFEAEGAAPAVPHVALGILQAPVIGRAQLDPAKTAKGRPVKAGDVVGHVETQSGRAEVVSPFDGTVSETPAGPGTAVGHGETLLVLEIKA